MVSQKESNYADYEVLVIDNASDDETRQLVLSIVASCPCVRYIYERQLGLSQARNRGIAEAKGDIVAFIDDDSEPKDDWVSSLAAAYKKYPEAWAIGGKTVPKCDEPRPSWFCGRMLRYLGGHDYGNSDLLLEKYWYLGGGNMSFKRHIFSVLGGFCTELGRNGKNNLSHEEGELFHRIHALRKPVYYVPQILAYHWQPKERLEFSQLASIRYNYGRSESMVDWVYRRKVFVLAKSGKKVILVLGATIIIPLLVILRRRSDTYYLLLRSCFTAGYVFETIRQCARGRTLTHMK
jgi:glycosyltransferase involved in cell wall biosynthesis